MPCLLIPEQGTYLKKAIASLLFEFVPDYEMGPNENFDIHSHSHGFLVRTNLDFKQLDARYKERVASATTLTPATLLTAILSVRRDLSLGLKYGTDIAVSNRSSQLLQFKIDGILAKRLSNAEHISRFHDMILPEVRSVREAINSGQLQFSDFLKVLDEAHKFKNWLKGVPPEINLVTEYYKEISKNDWLSGLNAFQASLISPTDHFVVSISTFR